MLPSQSQPWSRSSSFTPLIIFCLGLGIVMASTVLIGKTSLGLFVVAGVVAIIGGAVIMIRPDIGLYTLVFFIFTNMSDVLETSFGVPDTNKLLVALIFVGTLTNQIILHNKPLIFRTTELAILAYMIYVVVSLAVNGVYFSPYTANPDATVISITIDWLKDFLILFVIVQQCTNERTWKNMQVTLLAAAAFLGMLSCYQALTGNFANEFYGLAKAPVHQITSGFDSNRVTGPLDDPNFYALILLMAVPVGAYRIYTEKNFYLRALAFMATGSVGLAIVFTYSRGAFVALMVLAILFVYERKMNVYKVAFITLVIVVAVSPILPQGFTARLSTLTDVLPGGGAQNQTESSFRGRSSEAMVAGQMFLDHPIIGVGLQNYANRYLDYSVHLGLDGRLQARQAHSLYLEVAAENGLVGLMLFGAMLAIVFLEIRRARGIVQSIGRDDLLSWISGVQFGLIAYLLASIFLHGDYSRYFWMQVAFVAATSVMAEEQLRRHRAATIAHAEEESQLEFDTLPEPARTAVVAI